MSDNEGKNAGKVTAHTYGAVDTSNAQNECWLIRVPPSLAHVWNKAPEGSILGNLVFTKGGPASSNPKSAKPVRPALELNVAPEMFQEEDEVNPEDDTPVVIQTHLSIPLNYSMQAMTKKIPSFHPFSRNPQDGSVKLWGTVSRTANLQVKQDRKYRQLLKDRLTAANVTSSRFVKPADAPQSVVAKQQRKVVTKSSMTSSNSKRKYPGDDGDEGPEEIEAITFSSAVYKFGQRNLEAQQAQDSAHNAMLAGAAPKAKRPRQFSPNQPMRSVIFELFEQQKYWTVKVGSSFWVAW